MTQEEFEKLLSDVAEKLTSEAQSENSFKTAKGFENRVREVLVELGENKNIEILRPILMFSLTSPSANLAWKLSSQRMTLGVV